MVTNITPRVSGVEGLWTTYIIRQMVPGLKAELLFQEYCEPALVPRQAGGSVARWNIPTMSVGTTAALTAGTLKPATQHITITKVETTISDYGDWMQIDDLAHETAVTEALDSYKDVVMYAAASSLDKIHYDQAVATTYFMHCDQLGVTAGLTLANGDQFKAADIPTITEFFRSSNAKGWDGLSKDYMLAIHPVVEKTLVTDVTTGALSWAEVNKHVPAGFEQLINNHRFVGRFNGLSILRTTNGTGTTVSENVDSYRCVAMARYGVGTLGLGTKGPKAPELKFKSPGPHSTNDPLDQIHTLGWKFRAAPKLLDGKRALVVYSAVT